VTFFLVEIIFRSYDALRGGGFFTTPGNILARSTTKAIPFRTFGFDPYVKVGGEMMISSRWRERYPFEKPVDTLRIVCFGGSTTEARANDYHYPLVLQSLLRERLGTQNIEVINVGNAAYATSHLIILLALDVISWSPDLVILSENFNDLLAMYFPGFRVDYWNKYSHEFYTGPDNSQRYTWPNVVFQHSRLYWFLYHRLEQLRYRRERLTPTIQRRPYGNLPNPEAIDVFRRNLQTFVHIARSRGIPVLLGTQPLQPSEEYFVRHMAHKPYNDIVLYPHHNEFVQHHAAFNRIIRDVASEMGTSVIDHDMMFGGQERYFIDHVHYTEQGIRQLAENYAEVIIQHGRVARAKQEAP
jgi:hypothetical protein